MKVVHINVVNQYSGTGRMTADMHQMLLDHNVDSYVICARELHNDDRRVLKFSSYLENKFHALFSRVFGLQGYFSFVSTFKMIRFFEKLKPDIIILGNLHSNFVNIPMLYKYVAKNDIPTMLLLYDCWYFTGRCVHYTEDQCFRWQHECGKCPALKKGCKSYFFDCSRKMLRDKKRLIQRIPRLAVVGISDWITDDAKKSILKDAKWIERHYVWVDMDIFHPVDASVVRKQLHLEDKFVVLAIAQSWYRQKGIMDLYRLAEYNPELNIVIVGQMKDDIKELMESLSNVRLLSDTNDLTLLAQYYSMADVLVNPSIQETFGLTMAEAMACGTPVLAYQNTSMPEVIGKDCGKVLPLHDIEALNDAIEEIKANGKNSYTKSCISHVRTHFEKKLVLDEYWQLINKMLK